jgi:hypothetical protein
MMMRPPGYRRASTKEQPEPERACLNCRFVTDNRCHAYCVKYSAPVNPWYVCDEWTSRKMVATPRLKIR